MSLNSDKCKVISFSRLALPTNAFYRLNDVLLIYTSNYKYLGIPLTSDLSWSCHIPQIIASANKILGYLRRNLKLATPRVKQLTSITLARPKLEISSSIWGSWQNYFINELERIQNRALHFIFRKHSPYTSATSLRERADIQSLEQRRKLSRLSLLHEIDYHNPNLRDAMLSPPNCVFPRFDNTAIFPVFLIRRLQNVNTSIVNWRVE